MPDSRHDATRDSPPRALHVATERTWRGGEAQALHLARVLAKADETALLAPPESPLYQRAKLELGDRCKLFALPGRGRNSPANWLATWLACRSYKPDVVQTHTAHAHSLAWMAAPRSIPIVATRRVDFAIPAKGLRGGKYRSRRVWNVAISRAIATILRGAGVAEERLALIPSGIDPARFADLEGPLARAERRASARLGLGLPEGDDAILAGNIAALAGHKGQRHLVEAASILAKRDPPVPRVLFVVAGEGEERADLEARIAERGLARGEGKRVAVELLGHRDDVPGLLAAFDLFVMPSAQEGLGTAVLDALWMGLPVAATSAGGITDIIRDGENGLLAPPEDAAGLAAVLGRMLDDADLRHRLAATARPFMESSPFLAERMAASYQKLYERVVAEWKG